jgi:hypothetical protein
MRGRDIAPLRPLGTPQLELSGFVPGSRLTTGWANDSRRAVLRCAFEGDHTMSELVLETTQNAYDAAEKDIEKDITDAYNKSKNKIKNAMPSGVSFDASQPDIKGILFGFRKLKEKGDKKIREVKFVAILNSAQLTLVARVGDVDHGCGSGADVPPESNDLTKVKARREFFTSVNKFNKALVPDSVISEFNKKHPPGLEQAAQDAAKLLEVKKKLAEAEAKVTDLKKQVKELEDKVKPFAAQLKQTR